MFGCSSLGKYVLEKPLIQSKPSSLIAILIIDLTEEKILFTVFIDSPLLISQSLNLAPSELEISLTHLLPIALITYLMFLLAVRWKTLSWSLPFYLKYNSSASTTLLETSVLFCFKAIKLFTGTSNLLNRTPYQ